MSDAERAERARPRNALSRARSSSAGAAQRVDHHQRTLALEQITVDLLAVRGSRLEIQQIVLDLECGAEKEAQLDQRVQRQPLRVRR